MPVQLLHIAHTTPVEAIWTDAFRAALAERGTLTLVEDGGALTESQRGECIRGCDILLTGWGTATVPACVAAVPGRLRYVCHITGGMRGAIPLEVVEAGIPVTNWGDAPANGVAEGAMALLLAALKDLHAQVRAVRAGGWALDPATHYGSLEDLDVGVYGCGVIGRRFVELLRPFGARIRVYDPFAPDLPPGCERVASLEDLFRSSQAIVIHAALCEGTERSVTARLLALLPRHGIVVNTARGGIVDQDALFAELETGRLRAALDVTDPEPLSQDHPARRWENLILSGHRIEYGWPMDGRPSSQLDKKQRICLENIRRFLAGEPLQFLMDRRRYLLST